MAAKRKGGLKLNAICAKLSRQVVFDSSSQNAEGEQSERGSSHYDDTDTTNFPDNVSLSQSLEDDQRRREAIEKWVNGEYGDEQPPLDHEHELKGSTDEDGPPEGVYMVQPKGCSDDEDEEAEPAATPASDRDAEDKALKDAGYAAAGDGQSRQVPFSSPGTDKPRPPHKPHPQTSPAPCTHHLDQQSHI